ncbi:MAG: PQQ-dependent sugar dehydrogenase [Acidimicrobiia bacterium]
MSRSFAAMAFAGVVASAGCGSTIGGAEGVATPDGFEVSVVVDQLVGPTQFYLEHDGSIVAAHLNGGENESGGRVVRLDPKGGETEVLFTGLDKPTGVLARDDEIWVMEATQLSRGSASGGRLETVLTDLPNNGRSQGTLTLTPDGDVLFNTSGSKRGAMVAEGSGRLWQVSDDGIPVEVASGFKHAYAHAFGSDGVLWSTEMSDGKFDGQIPEDELVQVIEGVDHGWPYCVGANRPVAEFGRQECDGVPESIVTFGPGATPTSVVLSPFVDGGLHVALWARGEVVSLSQQAKPGRGDGFVPFLSGLVGPQHLVAHDGRLYISEFGSDRILAVVPANP